MNKFPLSVPHTIWQPASNFALNMKMGIKSNFLDKIMAREIDGIATLHNDHLKCFWLQLQGSSDLQNQRNSMQH